MDYGHSSGPDWRRASGRRRAAAIGLTLGAELLFLLLLLGLNPGLLPTSSKPSEPTLIDLGTEPAAHPQPKRAVAVKRKVAPTVHQPVEHRAAAAPPKFHSPSFIPLSSAEMASADIAHLGTKGAPAQVAETSGVAGPGEGPGGAHLYKAEWQIEPTDAQLSAYLPKAIERGSWAEIACKTIAHYHVENCQPLGESPPGSGLARGLRLAAWQFQVRPLNLDGKPLVGSWVRIRFDFSKVAQ